MGEGEGDYGDSGWGDYVALSAPKVSSLRQPGSWDHSRVSAKGILYPSSLFLIKFDEIL